MQDKKFTNTFSATIHRAHIKFWKYNNPLIDDPFTLKSIFSNGMSSREQELQIGGWVCSPLRSLFSYHQGLKFSLFTK